MIYEDIRIILRTLSDTELSQYHYKMFLPSERLCILLIILPQWSYQICELLTNEEVHSIFQTECDTVPEYQVVPVMLSLNTKNTSNPRVYFKSFGEDVMLYLRPAEGMLFGRHTPVYTVESHKSSPKGLLYTKYDTYGIYNAYQDELNNAAIIVRQGTNDSYKFDGTYGQHFAIRSIPERVIEEVINKNESYHQSKLFPNVLKNNESSSQTVHHLIIRMVDVEKALRNYYNPSYLNESLPIRHKRNLKNDFGRMKTDLNIVYPEIMSIVEYDTFRFFKSDISEVLVYLTAFWNGVDLRYRSLRDPKVRLNIATIIIGLDRNATPYLNNYRVNGSRINTDSIQAMGRYFYNEERFEKSSYDIVIAVTRSTVCERSKTSGNAICVPLRGMSQLGSACMRNNEKKTVESVGLIHDQGFNGVATAAHELGHILGVPHDGSPSPQYIAGPGATKCSWQDGYMMSSERFGSNAFKWSNCSLECFEFFLRQPVAKCLYNKPKFDTALPKILPGTLLSLDQQCYQTGALEACYHDERACVLLYCTMPEKRDHCLATAPAAEGSTCGDGKMITDVQLAIFSNILGVTLFFLVFLFHYINANYAK